MLSYTDLKKGTLFVLNGQPHEVLEANFSRMQQRKAVVQAKIRNLATGKITETTLQASDEFEKADVERRMILFLYQHRGEFVFCDPDKEQNRFTVREDIIGERTKWLKPNTRITALFFNEKLISLSLPIKMDFRVEEAPPGIQGDRAQGGTKAVTLETGALVQTPLFINSGDIVRINTQTGEYVERMEKA